MAADIAVQLAYENLGESGEDVQSASATAGSAKAPVQTAVGGRVDKHEERTMDRDEALRVTCGAMVKVRRR